MLSEGILYYITFCPGEKKKKHNIYTCCSSSTRVPNVSLNEISDVNCSDPKAVSSGNKTFMVFGDLESVLGFELERLSLMAALFESGKLQIYLTI